METSNIARGTFQVTLANAFQYLVMGLLYVVVTKTNALASTATVPFLIAIELTLSSKLPTIQTLAIEIITAAGIYAFSLYALKALNNQDFELLRQTFPKPLTKYVNILESIIVRP